MAGIWCGAAPSSSPALRFRIRTRVPRTHCSGSGPTPRLVKVAVAGVTELLRLFNFIPKEDTLRLETASYEEEDGISVLSVDDVVNSLKCDYENDYFVTGVFNSAIYAEDCIFEDPTISFRGKDLYARNLKLLVPFFDQPSIGLKNIEKSIDSEMNFVLAKWKLRTYLKLPWRPLISIDGRTIYELDDTFKIVRHAEEWDVSALEAIGQIFTPSSEKSID